MRIVPFIREGTVYYSPTCEKHNYAFKGRPPMTTGCWDCWMSYYFTQACLSKDPKESVEQLESAIMHATEQMDKGEWDFTPLPHPEIEIEEDAE